ncbi:MAG: sulfotransferase family protein [Sphingomicrobium sp.]
MSMPDASSAAPEHAAPDFDLNQLLPLACIVGAPRCGTTFLSRFLNAHPSVCFAKPKEPHFFAMQDLSDVPDETFRAQVLNQYLRRFFNHLRPTDTTLAEGSVSYLYAAERVRAILRLWPDAKFIISLRDPLQLLPSIHQRLRYQGDENVREFDRAWRLCPERAQGRRIPRSCLDPRLLRYDEIGQLGKHVGDFFEAVGKERCLVILYDDIVEDSGAVLQRALHFLGLPSFEYESDRRRRARQGFRFGWLQRLLKRPPVVTRAVLAGEKYRQRVVDKPAKDPGAGAKAVMRLRKRLIAWNEAPPPPTIISPEVEQEMREMFSADIDRLAVLIERDLSHWLGRKGD